MLTNSTVCHSIIGVIFFSEGVVFHDKSGIETKYMKLGKLCVYQERTTVPCTKLRLYANTNSGIIWAERRGTNS